MVHILAPQLGRHSAELSRAQAPRLHVVFRCMHGSPHVGNRLNGHAGDVQMTALLQGAADERVHRHAGDLRDVAERDGFAQQAQDVAAAGPAQGTPGVVRGALVPASQSGGFCVGDEARGVVLVREREQVGGDGAVVRLFEAW